VGSSSDVGVASLQGRPEGRGAEDLWEDEEESPFTSSPRILWGISMRFRPSTSAYLSMTFKHS